MRPTVGTSTLGVRSEEFTDYVFLTQTDTTVGFVSQNSEKLTRIKQRPPHKHYIKAVDSLQTLKTFTRIPHAHKNRVRRNQKTTFITPDTHSYRVIHDPHHLQLIKRLRWAYTTSANISGEMYDETYAAKAADVTVSPLQHRQSPSQILKLGRTAIKRIR